MRLWLNKKGLRCSSAALVDLPPGLCRPLPDVHDLKARGVKRRALSTLAGAQLSHNGANKLVRSGLSLEEALFRMLGGSTVRGLRCRVGGGRAVKVSP